MSRRASSAALMEVAASAATGAPTYRRTTLAGCSGRAMARTAPTPGCWVAPDRSMARTAACGSGERNMRPYNMPGSTTSTVKRVAPVTLARPSCRATGLPMTERSAFVRSAGGSSTGISRRISATPTLAIPRGRLSVRTASSFDIAMPGALSPRPASRQRHEDRSRSGRHVR